MYWLGGNKSYLDSVTDSDMQIGLDRGGSGSGFTMLQQPFRLI